MPQVQPTEVTSEDSQKQLDAQESLQKDLQSKIEKGDVFKSLTEELPEEIKKPDVQGDRKKQAQEEPEPEEEPQDPEPETEEDVIPKSKIQPRFDALTARLKAQEAEIAELKIRNQTPVDETQRTLDAMNETELEDTLIQVKAAGRKSEGEELLKLVKLERQIERSISTAPQRFTQKQIGEFNTTLQRLASEGEINNDTAPKVIEIAKEIYARYSKLQNSIDGQAMALELATEHFKKVGQVEIKKAETNNLKSQVNTLKKKTMLDTKSIKTGGDRIELEKLRNNAMTGTMRDKNLFVLNDPRFKIDAMIPDHLKG